jgi:hypothetical protein
MGKNLTNIEDNTRVVLFEKYQLYHYKFEKGGKCLEVCNVRKGEKGSLALERGFSEVHIGSGACEDCIFNAGYSKKMHFVICRNIVKAISFNK